MKNIEKIIRSGLCLGCGLCESICTSTKCKMILNEGFNQPLFLSEPTVDEIKQIYRCCPGIHVESKKYTGIWGNIITLKESWSTDLIIRKKSSSGGVITSLAIYLLESHRVNAILHVGTTEESYLYNQLSVSHTREEVLNRTASRYAPALMFNKLADILKSSDETFAFIGKPCDIAGLKNFLEEYPIYQKRIIYFLSIFCAGMPSYQGTKEVLKLSGNEEEPYFIKYRGDGWPGFFEAYYLNRPTFKLSYNESWGKVLNQHLNFRCKICPDGIGILADIAVGDSWKTKDGYPDFEEDNGKSFVMIRTHKGQSLFDAAVEHEYISSEILDTHKIKEIQAYQYQRRKLIGYRILPVQLLSGFILNFRGLGIWRSMLTANAKKGMKNLLGTTKRFIKR